MTSTSAADRPLFIAQDKLTQWEGEGKVVVADNVLTLVAEKRSYLLAEAVRFLKLVGSDQDPHGLVGRVRTRDQLKALKAEHYMGSAIVGDTAYEVQEGWVGTVVSTAPRPAAAAPPPPTPAVAPPPPVVAAPQAVAQTAPPPKVPPKDAQPATDAQLLADFLLSNMSG